MYKYVEISIMENGISKKDIAAKLNITYNTLLLKLSGKSKFTLDEALALKEILGTQEPVESLFKTNKNTA